MHAWLAELIQINGLIAPPRGYDLAATACQTSAVHRAGVDLPRARADLLRRGRCFGEVPTDEMEISRIVDDIAEHDVESVVL